MGSGGRERGPRLAWNQQRLPPLQDRGGLGTPSSLASSLKMLPEPGLDGTRGESPSPVPRQLEPPS